MAAAFENNVRIKIGLIKGMAGLVGGGFQGSNIPNSTSTNEGFHHAIVHENIHEGKIVHQANRLLCFFISGQHPKHGGFKFRFVCPIVLFAIIH